MAKLSFGIPEGGPEQATCRCGVCTLHREWAADRAQILTEFRDSSTPLPRVLALLDLGHWGRVEQLFCGSEHPKLGALAEEWGWTHEAVAILTNESDG